MASAKFISDAPTLACAVVRAFQIYRDAPHLGRRDATTGESTWLTYQETGEQASLLAAGLLSHPTVSLSRRGVLAIAAPNCIEWILSDFACALNDYMSVGIHIGWSQDKVDAILDDCGVEVVVASPEALPLFDKARANGCGRSLRCVVLLGPAPTPTAEFDVVPFADVLAAGKGMPTATGYSMDNSVHVDRGDDSSQPFTLMYSSGTTGGPPKAVCTPKAVWRETNCNPGPLAAITERRCVSFMSLAHGADRGIVWFSTMAGGSVGVVSHPEGSEGFFDDLRSFRPTFFLGMSYFWQDLYTRHMHSLLPKVDQHIAQTLGESPPSSLLRALRDAYLRTREGVAMYRAECKRLREGDLGGQLMMVATGGAHTPAQVLEFMKGCLTDGNEERVADSYGSTEFPGIAANGVVAPTVEVRLEEVAGYSPSDLPHPRGEILVRRKTGGATSYWRRPDLTSWDSEGWYHTGDVGELDYSNTAEPPLLRVIDRVKFLEEVYWGHDSVWIAPGGLEDRFASLPEVTGVVLFADRNRPGVVAIVQSTFPPDDVLAAMQHAGKTWGLPDWEIPVGVVVDSFPWTEEAGLLTLTGKPNRAAIKQRNMAAVGEVYGEVEVGGKAVLRVGDPDEMAVDQADGRHNADRATALLHAYRTSAEVDMYSQAQLQLMRQDPRMPHPLVKKGSRVLDTTFTTVSGEVKDVNTPRGRDWISGEEKLRFRKVAFISAEGEVAKDPPRKVVGWTNTVVPVVVVGERGSGSYEVSANSLEQIRVFRLRVAAEAGVVGVEVQVDGVRVPETTLVEALVGKSIECTALSTPYHTIPEEAVRQLEQCFDELCRKALYIRAMYPKWSDDRAARREQAVLAVKRAAAMLEGVETEQDPSQAAHRILKTHEAVARANEVLARAGPGPEEEAAWFSLDDQMVALRELGDRWDIDTRGLPVTWRLNIDWVVPPNGRETVQCVFGCGKMVYTEELEQHSNNYDGPCNPLVGVCEDDDERGTAMGGDQSVVCELSGVVLDPEDTDLTPTDPTASLPYRTPRVHSIDSHVDRDPRLHELVGKLRDQGPCELLEQLDRHADDVWVRDKQHIFWLHSHVCKGKDIGRFDTPASMFLRACDAFPHRPVLGVPTEDVVSSAALPRTSSRWVLPEAAGAHLVTHRGFRWLRYCDLGSMVCRIATGLSQCPGSTVLIAGYNDFEWAVADFACAVAGKVSVGLHTTYNLTNAMAVAKKAKASTLLCMGDLVTRRSDRRWNARELVEGVGGVRNVVGMDTSHDDMKRYFDGVDVTVHSFLSWVSSLPPLDVDPFSILGAKYGDEFYNTLLFTSGTSGDPKAVVMGCKAFTADIAGDRAEREAVSKSLTVSYIPLSHSSDRYKVWQHVVLGGRVGFCVFAPHHWEAHETEKKDHMLSYVSPVEDLFRQVSTLCPTSMACPPNIWAGLYDIYTSYLTANADDPDREQKGLHEVARLLGRRMVNMATGGAPTPSHLIDFAKRLCAVKSCSFVNSYGATECGAVTTDGYQFGSKFEDVIVHLVDRPDLGFTTKDSPFPRGEVAVSSPSLALGYYDDPAREREAFIEVGKGRPFRHPALPDHDQPQPPREGRWYLTGDLAAIDNTSRLVLIDRVSAVVSTSEGVVISMGELEAAVESLPGVVQAFVVASPASPVVKCVVVGDNAPELGAAGPWGVMPFGEEDMDQLHRHQGWKRVEGALGGAPFRMAKADRRWTVANGVLSGELKKQRSVLRDIYLTPLSALFP